MNRPLTEEERNLVELVLSASKSSIPVPRSGTIVRPLTDGGMGSVSFDLLGDRRFGSLVGDLKFVDADGVPVLASVYADRDGNLFELDLFKVDFSAVHTLPES